MSAPASSMKPRVFDRMSRTYTVIGSRRLGPGAWRCGPEGADCIHLVQLTLHIDMCEVSSFSDSWQWSLVSSESLRSPYTYYFSESLEIQDAGKSFVLFLSFPESRKSTGGWEVVEGILKWSGRPTLKEDLIDTTLGICEVPR